MRTALGIKTRELELIRSLLRSLRLKPLKTSVEPVDFPSRAQSLLVEHAQARQAAVRV